MIAVGTMTWGRETSEAEARRCYSLARERGVVWFDTASLYSDGEAERLLGQFVRDDHRSEEVQISTKGGYRGEDVYEALQGSLQRLGADRVALFLHHHYGRYPEALDGAERMLREGLAGAFGLSNCAAWQACDFYEALCTAPTLQVLYSLAKRQAEVELLPYAKAFGGDVFAYSPLAAGLLTGKYEEGEGANGPKRLVTDRRYRERFSDWPGMPDAYLAVAEVLGMTPGQLAVAWVECHPLGIIPIVGARNAEQLTELLDRKSLSGGAWRAVGGMFRRPPPATDRLEESEDR